MKFWIFLLVICMLSGCYNAASQPVQPIQPAPTPPVIIMKDHLYRPQPRPPVILDFEFRNDHHHDHHEHDHHR